MKRGNSMGDSKKTDNRGGFRNEFRKSTLTTKLFLLLVGKAAGAEWKSMSEEEKTPFIDKAKKLKRDYEHQMEAYNRKLISHGAQHLLRSLPACTDDSTERPSSSSDATYLIPAEIPNPIENLITSTEADLLHGAHSSPNSTETVNRLPPKKSKNTQHTLPKHSNNTPKSSRGRTLKAKKLD